MSHDVMTEEVRAMTDAARMTAGLCPECGYKLAPSTAIAHRNDHWQRKPSEETFDALALKRYQMVTAFSKANPAPVE